MTDVTIHDTKQEWEGNYCEDSRIDLFVAWHGILVDYQLEILGKFIGFK